MYNTYCGIDFGTTNSAVSVTKFDKKPHLITFENNKMPENVYSLYLNGTKGVISKVDDYIEYAKTTKINAFVVDIKENINNEIVG